MNHDRQRLILLAALLLAVLPCQAQPINRTDTTSRVVVFPTSRLFRPINADGIAHRFGVSKDFTSALIYGCLGGQIPLIEVRFSGIAAQFGPGATVLTSIVKRPRLLEVVTVDFLVEFPVDVQISQRVTLRSGYGHFSAHFADDGIEIQQRSSINYAKDYVMLLGSYSLPEADAIVYSGGHWNFHSLPGEDRNWTAQVGAEAGNLEVLPSCFAYAAVDVRLKSEVAWASTQSYQCGVRLFPRGDRAVRVVYTFRTGIDDRGQFFRERTALHLVGVYLDF
jgi:hypothetical protein